MTRTLIMLRIGCPIALLASCGLGVLAWQTCRFDLVAFNAFLIGVNLCLSLFNWFVLPFNHGR